MSAKQKVDSTRDDNGNNLNNDGSSILSPHNKDAEFSHNLTDSSFVLKKSYEPILIKNKTRRANTTTSNLSVSKKKPFEHKTRSVFNVRSSTPTSNKVPPRSPRAQLLKNIQKPFIAVGNSSQKPEQNAGIKGDLSTDSSWLISYNTSLSRFSPSWNRKLLSPSSVGTADDSCSISNSADSHKSQHIKNKNKQCGSLKPLPARFKSDYPNLWSTRKSTKSVTQDLNNFTWFAGRSSIESLISTPEFSVPYLTASAFPDADIVPKQGENEQIWTFEQQVVVKDKEPNWDKYGIFDREKNTQQQNFISIVHAESDDKLNNNIALLRPRESQPAQAIAVDLQIDKENEALTDITNYDRHLADVSSDFYESIDSLVSPKLNDSDVQGSSERSLATESSVEIGDGSLIENKDEKDESVNSSNTEDMSSPLRATGQIYSSSEHYPVVEEKHRGVIGTVHPWLRYSLFPHMPPTINFRVENSPALSIPSEVRRVLKWKSTSVTPVIIRKVLYNSGMRLVKRSQQWISVWAKHMRANMFKTVLEFQKFNHFPGTFQIGRKDTLWRNHLRLRSVHGKRSYDFVPTTYVIPADMKQLRHAWEKSGTEQMWIVKPPAAARGSGIKVIHKFVQIPKMRPLVIQKYLQNPYLINGMKFDLRIYVYVTSFYPLRIYVYKEGLARFACALYSPSSQTVGDRYMHLTNFSVNRKSGNYTANEDVDACKGHKWSLKALWGFLAEQGHNTTTIWNSIVDLIIKTVISCENTVSTLTRLNMKNPSSCHELFGFDVILDSKLKPWLLEVNISPSLQSSSKLDVNIKGQMCKDLLNLSGVMIPPHVDKAFQTGFLEKVSEDAGFGITNLCFDKRIFRSNLSLEERAKQAVFSRMDRHEYLLTVLANPTADDIRQLVLAEDERSRAGQYICVYPTHHTYRYHKFFDRARYYNHLFDAWETRYHNCRDDGIQKLVEACKQGLHLKVIPQSASMGSPRTDINSLSSMSSLNNRCCPRSKTNRAFRRACRSARSLISRMKIRRSNSRPKSPLKKSTSTPSNMGSCEPQSNGISNVSGMSSLAVHKTDSSQTKAATSFDAEHPFQNEDVYAAYTNTWQSHHCNAFAKSKHKLRQTETSPQISSKQKDRVYPHVRNIFPPERTRNFEVTRCEDSSSSDSN